MLIPELHPNKKPCDIRSYFHAKGLPCLANPPKYPSRDEYTQPEHGNNWFDAPWISWSELRADVAAFSSRLATMPLSGVAGIPRSGMIVASDIAVRLGLPLYAVSDSGLTKLDTGLRLRNAPNLDGPILVMEDSTASGRSIKEARSRLVGLNVLFGAIYATPQGTRSVDLHHRILPLPHWFEWNMLGNPALMRDIRIAIDFDGILCPDFTPAEDDDGKMYRQRMRSMPIIRHPGVATLPHIITARLEKYRGLTEHWLSRRRVKYDRLTMGPWSTKQEREAGDVAAWKAQQCIESNTQIYIESCPEQSRRIAGIAPSVAVLCPGETPPPYHGGRVFSDVP
ncbi:hypothetical protein [Planctomycetes bacterium TBK1r]|uniref:hypothetical protein n=1 Tax=Stieleria magnilauensis TaxID=2527963 RepID=UPI00119F28FD